MLLFGGGGLPCCLARQLQIPFHSYCRGESVWFWGCEVERPARGSGEAKRSDALVPGMQDFTEGFVPRSSGCRGAHLCRSGSVWQPASAGGCAGDPRAGAWAGCHVLLCEKWGRAPLVEKLLGQGCSGSCSQLWDVVDDFNECFFPFLSKPSAFMESPIQVEVPSAPVEPFCVVLIPVVKFEPLTPARC